jgi:hypothetical protein
MEIGTEDKKGRSTGHLAEMSPGRGALKEVAVTELQQLAWGAV